jgi:hypothetical protein
MCQDHLREPSYSSSARLLWLFFPNHQLKVRPRYHSGKAIDSYSLDRGFEYCHWHWERENGRRIRCHDSQHNDILHNDTPHNGFIWYIQYRVPLFFIAMLSVAMLSVAMLSVAMLSVTMLSVTMLSVVMLNVVTPKIKVS